MRTELLFYKDNNLFTFQAKVLDCVERDDLYALILDRTAFFYEGGGQHADSGTINGIEVVNVLVEDGEILHFTKEPIAVGEVVIGLLNERDRIDKMRNHTGEHILSAVVHRRFGFDNVGFHMGQDAMSVDFNGEMSKEELEDVEREVNEIIRQNHRVVTYYPTAEQLKTLNYRSKLELDNPRIVEIEDVDLCACCAPHVSFTGEIGLCKIIYAEKNRGNQRLTLLCGRFAFDYLQRVSINARGVAERLSSTESELFGAFARYEDSVINQRAELNQIKRDYAKLLESTLKETENHLLVFCPDFAQKEIITRACELTSRTAAVFSQKDSGFVYMLSSHTEDVRVLQKQLNQALHGVGGGKTFSAQGRVQATKEEIESFFESLNK